MIKPVNTQDYFPSYPGLRSVLHWVAIVGDFKQCTYYTNVLVGVLCNVIWHLSTKHDRIPGHHRSIKHHRGRSSFTWEEKRTRHYSLQRRLPRYTSEMRCTPVCLSLHMQIEPTCRIWNIFRARVTQTSPSRCPEQASRQAEHVQINPPSFQYTPSTFLALLLLPCCERKRPAVQQAPRTILHTMRMIMKSQTCKTSPSPFSLERWRRVEEVALHPSATIDSQPNNPRFSYSSR